MAQPEPQPLTASVTVPEHVVMRAFEGEVVLLNLESGQYHGLNPVGARMYEAARDTGNGEGAVATLMAEYDQPREIIERDLANLLSSLAERGLIVLGDSG